MQRFFTWSDFDKAVDFIASKCKFMEFSGVYGIPRGGLCLAVALSHKLKIKLLSKPIENSLIVDDIYESGVTLNSLRKIKGSTFFVLFSKQIPKWWSAVILVEENNWIVFPWEDSNFSYDDQKEYINKRNLK